MKKVARMLFLVFLLSSFVLVVSYAETFPLYSGRNLNQVGTVDVVNTISSVEVKYTAFDGYAFRATHLEVAKILSGIPQKNGNPIPGQFRYKRTYNTPVKQDAYIVPVAGVSSGCKLYIATHAEVCEGNGAVVDTYTMNNYSANPFSAMYYASEEAFYRIALQMRNGTVASYEAFCANPYVSVYMNKKFYNVTLTSSYKSGVISNPGPINYVLNTYGWTDWHIAQVAIWRLLGWNNTFLDPASEVLVNVMVADAMTHTCYIPPVGGVYGVLCKIKDCKGTEIQPCLAMFLVPTKTTCGGCETAWGGTNDFSGRNWALWIEYLLK